MDLGLDICHKNNQSKTPRAKDILIVEPDRHNATYLNDFLISKGYQVSIATHEEEGLHILETQTVSGILLSLDDTNRAGRQIVRDIRAHYSHIPLVVMGTELTRRTIREAFGEGVKGFMSKPLFHDQLNEALFIFEGQVI